MLKQILFRLEPLVMLHDALRVHLVPYRDSLVDQTSLKMLYEARMASRSNHVVANIIALAG
jgi:hypothetical protein